ncbi:uncharacterized protein LOC128884774 [Hylaeus volcanicus]|uniref:uncharacterized protein LOC128884774 n=1 Tax=Hylaeus volcanicus TaxID=313075 RepID=UPI0023B8704D|nr:uncharacterized protein LOC128884774 [Hylaeus volcanicus]
MDGKRTRKVVISVEEYIRKVDGIRDIVNSLEESVTISRHLEAERWLRYSVLKAKNKVVSDDLEKANKRNKSMLNLFRQSVTDVRLGSEITLPESLKREVQRTWHEKYDALLAQNEQLKNDIARANLLLEDKRNEIDDLQQKLLSLGDKLIERNEAVENICKKYLSLKKRKDEQEMLLRGSIETLQDSLKKTNSVAKKGMSGMSLIPSKDTLLARETRRSDRLAYENSLLRVLLQEARHECNASESSTLSFERTA